MKGVWGKYAFINLSTQKIEIYEIPTSWYEKHLGGRGIAARIAIEEVVKKQIKVDPLGENNILIFGTGPWQGTGCPGSGKFVLAGWSPKTRTFNESYAGGAFGHKLALTGYDGVLIVGKAEEPCFVLLLDDQISVEPANEIWGLYTGDCEDWLREKYGSFVSVASIGPAGEKGVKFACVISDYCHAAGRPGFGAVMGAKRLKALVVGGRKIPPIHNQTEFRTAAKQFRQLCQENPNLRKLSKYGTAGEVLLLDSLGILPTRNFKCGSFSAAERISGEYMAETILVGHGTCAGCPVACDPRVKTEFAGEKVIPKYGGPEYETIASFGSLCLVDDLRVIALANQKCNQYGLDTISTGVLLAFLMEATELGVLEPSKGIRWGDGARLIELIDKIGRREGIGDFLAEGLDTVAKEMRAEDFAAVIKGVEVPMHEPRGKKGLAISYATSPRGATHLEAIHDELLEGSQAPTPELGVTNPVNRLAWENKAMLCKLYEDLYSFVNSIIICGFLSWNQATCTKYYPFPLIRRILNAVTGLEITAEEMLRIGERNYVLRKIIAALDGYSKKDDKLPPRLMQPLEDCIIAGESIDPNKLQKAIDEYYTLRGFDEFGPTDEKLQELNLTELKGLIKR
ncbi:MAG: aldehyde ferredoxin oxidoreductase family protein [Candidatus Bathyarchaeia archaeon]